MNKSRKKAVGILSVLLALGGVLWFMRNPNRKSWKQNGTAIDMSQYPLQWSLFSNKITVAGRTDGLNGVITGNTLTWSNGAVWTY